MTAYSQKIFRDFWQERTRTVLVVLAIALGISGFAAVLSAYAILTRELNRGYLATNPASAIVITDAVDDALLSAVLADHSVSDAEARGVVGGRIKTGSAEWRGLRLFVVKDFGSIRVSKLDPQQGAWPPADGEILVERDAMQVAHAHIGDFLTVRTANGQEHNLRLAGTVHDVGQAQARMENIVYGYIALGTLAQLGEKPVLDRLNILVAGDRLDEKHIRAVAANVQKVFESRGHPVMRLDVPTPGKHPHADIMGLLLLAMAAFGIFMLGLSSILVVNLMTALMASQVRQIGVLKAVGGKRWQIAGIYLGQTLLLGIAAILIALPVALLGSRALCQYLAVFLNFDIASFATPAWVYLLVMVSGLVVPILAAAYPVWKGCGIPVLVALRDFGVTADSFGADFLDRALAGVGTPMRPLLLAIRNSFRRRTRLMLTLATLAAGGLFFMSALNIRASLINTLDRLFQSRKFDLSVSLASMYPLEKIQRAARNTPGVVRLEGWIVAAGSVPVTGQPSAPGGHGGLHGGGDTSSTGVRFTAVALPEETNLYKLNIVQGRSLRPGDTNAVVLNSGFVSANPSIKVGSKVTLRIGPAELPWEVVGIAREPFSPSVAYISKGYIDELGGHGGFANSIRLVLDKTDADSINRVKATLERNLESEGVRSQSSSGNAEGRYGFDQHMLMIYVFLIVVSCIIAGIGGLGLMTTMSLNVLERRREMGVLRAIGASPLMIWLIIVTEGMVVGVLSWALASLAAWPISKALGNAIVGMMFQSNLDFYFEPSGPLLWLAFSILLGIVSSLLPAWHASRQTIREALAYA